ncbi:MAG TPA: hypothetical protein VLI05_01110 [Candidatus Saccharimonadia bacterium]|nr:hypothetical protein [Candidatus Saccharimonadia bacterium]
MSRSVMSLFVALVAALALTACGGVGGSPQPGPSTTITSAPTVVTTTAGSIAPSTAASELPTPDPSAWATTISTQPPRVVPGATTPPNGEPIQGVLRGIRWASGPGYERVAFTFDRAAPAYTARYLSTIVRDSSNQPVQFAGAAHLQIRFLSAHAFDAATGQETVTQEIQPVTGSAVLRAVVVNGDFDGTVSVAVDLNDVVALQWGSHINDQGQGVVYIDFKQ